MFINYIMALFGTIFCICHHACPSVLEPGNQQIPDQLNNQLDPFTGLLSDDVLGKMPIPSPKSSQKPTRIHEVIDVDAKILLMCWMTPLL